MATRRKTTTTEEKVEAVTKRITRLAATVKADATPGVRRRQRKRLKRAQRRRRALKAALPKPAAPTPT